MAMSPRLLRPRATGAFDAAAQVYFNAVAQADGQQLEPAVKKAINDFIVGCKRDGIWDAIKASCILMGAHTLSGALTPLVGSAPTNNGPFVSGDYDRKLGLIGNGTNKSIDTGRANNADPQNSKHLALYLTNRATSGGIGNASTSGGPSWFFSGGAGNSTARVNSSSSSIIGVVAASGFVGMSRSSSANFDARHSGTTTNYTNASTTPSSQNITAFHVANAFGSNRIAFYSIGESLDLALLDSRISALYTAIGAAIP